MRNPAHILVVDDNVSLADNIVEYLNRQGYRAQAAYGGKEGLTAFERGKFQVVITDLMMPGMDGMGLLEAIRKRAPEALVIMLTGYGTIKSAVNAVKAGACEYITKPLRLHEIEAAVRRALERTRRSRRMPGLISLAAVDLFLLVSAFELVHWLHYGNMIVSSIGYQLLVLIVVVWGAVSLFANKFMRILRMPVVGGVVFLLKTGMASLFLLSIILVGFHLTYFSRTMAYGTLGLFVILELEAFALYQWIRGPAARQEESVWKLPRGSISGSLLILDGVLLVLSFFAVTYLKRGSFGLESPYNDILLTLIGLWLAFSLFTGKFNRDNFNDISTALGAAAKTALFMGAGLAFFIFLFRLGPISRFQALGPVPLFVLLEGSVFVLYSNYRRHGRMEADIEDADNVKDLVDKKENGPLPEIPRDCRVTEPVEQKLSHALGFFDPGIFEFISSHLDLNQVDRRQCALLKTDELEDLNLLDESSTSLIVNLHKLNDIRWFNRYFLVCHEKLSVGGYLVGKAHTTSTQYDYYLSKNPGFTGRFIYGLRFLWSRVFPKLPWLRKVYFAITKGRNRSVSRAELLGRLLFCGFEIVAEREIDRRLFVIARKAASPSINQNPSYGPIVTLNRIGMNGKVLHIYKFRTMHPYSEFLQDYVYSKQGLRKGGKLGNDFRVTGWGEAMRRLWLDELPMLYNWLKGDLQVFGVRPLSRHYLSLYPPEVQALRMKVKPGLVPPFYADMPVTFEEICESEKRYIEAYLRAPVRTQVRYLWRAVVNIVFRGARSH